MKDEEYKKLKRKIEVKQLELTELQKLFLVETGRLHEVSIVLTPVCPECGLELFHVKAGNWRCEFCCSGEK